MFFYFYKRPFIIVQWMKNEENIHYCIVFKAADRFQKIYHRYPSKSSKIKGDKCKLK